MNRFPWAEAMRLAFGLMRLSPRDFWALTPRELAAVAEALAWVAPTAPSRAALDQLMQKFPDARRDG
ncbi:MAG: rcc01693 family protein [Cucumibacter sp.]